MAGGVAAGKYAARSMSSDRPVPIRLPTRKGRCHSKPLDYWLTRPLQPFGRKKSEGFRGTICTITETTGRLAAHEQTFACGPASTAPPARPRQHGPALAAHPRHVATNPSGDRHKKSCRIRRSGVMIILSSHVFGNPKMGQTGSLK